MAFEDRDHPRETTGSGRFADKTQSAPDVNLQSEVETEGVRWTPGDDTAMIADGTNPWLQVKGQAVNLLELGALLPSDGDRDCECPDVAGIIPAMDTEEGIQRCDACGRFDGDLDAAQHLAELLTERTGTEHTVWFEPAVKEPAPFVFDKQYGNHEQVRPFMDEFNRVHDEITDAGKYPYNDSFKGRIPALATTDGKNEDTAIYLMQGLRRIDEERVKLDAFAETGGRDIEVEDIPIGTTLRGTLVLHGFYVGGTGFQVVEDARLRRSAGTGRQLEYVEKGKRLGSIIGAGKVMFRED